MAVSVFTIISALDFGTLQYLNFRLYRLNNNPNKFSKTINILKIYNAYSYGSFLLIIIINFIIAINFYFELIFLSLGISTAYLNRYFQTVLRSYNMLPIGLLINSIPILCFIFILFLEKNGGLTTVGFYYFLCQCIGSLILIIFLRKKTDFTFQVILRKNKNFLFIKKTTKFWWLNLLQMITQFMPVILIGNLFTATQLMHFVTLKTIAALPLSVSLVLNNALQPLITDMVTKKVGIINKNILQIKILFGMCAVFLYSILYIFAEYIYFIWLGDKVVYKEILFLMLCMRSFIQIIIFLEQNISVSLGNPLSKIVYEVYMTASFFIGIIYMKFFDLDLEYFILLFFIIPQMLGFLHFRFFKK